VKNPFDYESLPWRPLLQRDPISGLDLSGPQKCNIDPEKGGPAPLLRTASRAPRGAGLCPAFFCFSRFLRGQEDLDRQAFFLPGHRSPGWSEAIDPKAPFFSFFPADKVFPFRIFHFGDTI